MPIVKDKDSNREDYLLQDDTKTKSTATFIVVVLILLIASVAISGVYFEWF
ncbi:hypothetical protein [Bizionia myxarmorum]|uniref:hypothetical protein n=1 Tax=Bizionia myxarmorum TaxID=291186 RepID=UPI00147974E8|nr:hypothetical protein [Bizionia myxarmorum]